MGEDVFAHKVVERSLGEIGVVGSFRPESGRFESVEGRLILGEMDGRGRFRPERCKEESGRNQGVWFFSPIK